MSDSPSGNPLLAPIDESFAKKRRKKTGLVPRNWLLAVLTILDAINEGDVPLTEDDVYTYDYTLKNSRAAAIPKLLEKYSLPTKLGMSSEGITVRGAPCLRMFRAMQGGGVIMDRPKNVRKVLVLEAVELVRSELMRVVGRDPIVLPSHSFDQTGTFVVALLEAVENRSFGRVEQALVGAKLHLRFDKDDVPINPAFAGDQQTGRECDYEVMNIRVIVSVVPKDQHFKSAFHLADEGRTVFLVVGDKSVSGAKHRVREKGYTGRVSVLSVEDYVTTNMNELSRERNLTPRQMCLALVSEYNRRIAADFDLSLRVIAPT